VLEIPAINCAVGVEVERRRFAVEMVVKIARDDLVLVGLRRESPAMLHVLSRRGGALVISILPFQVPVQFVVADVAHRPAKPRSRAPVSPAESVGRQLLPDSLG